MTHHSIAPRAAMQGPHRGGDSRLIRITLRFTQAFGNRTAGHSENTVNDVEILETVLSMIREQHQEIAGRSRADRTYGDRAMRVLIGIEIR